MISKAISEGDCLKNPLSAFISVPPSPYCRIRQLPRQPVADEDDDERHDGVEKTYSRCIRVVLADDALTIDICLDDICRLIDCRRIEKIDLLESYIEKVAERHYEKQYYRRLD